MFAAEGRARLGVGWRLFGGIRDLPELLLTYASVRLRLARRSLAELTADPMPLPRSGRSAGADAESLRLRHLTDAVLRRRPFRARCLVRALVIRELLRRRGIATQLVISVTTTGGRLRAHAEARLRADDDPAHVVLESAR